MGRGFLSGLFWGGIVSLVALFVSFQTLERQTLSFPQPNATEVEVPGGSEFNQARPETDPVVPATDARPEGDQATEVAVPDEAVTEPPRLETSVAEVPVPETTLEAPETLGAAPEAIGAVTEPERAPDSSIDPEVSDTLVEPEAPTAAPETAVVEPVPVEPEPEVEAERAPLIIIHDSPAADPDGTDVAALPETESAPEQPAQDSAPQVTNQVEAPDAPQSPDVSEAAELPWLDRLRASQIDKAPDAPELPEVTAEASLPPVTPTLPDVSVDGTVQDAGADVVAEVEETPAPSVVIEAPSQPETTEIAQADTAGSEGGSLLQPVETLTERDEGATSSGTLPTVRRLGVSDAETDPVEATEATGDDSAAAEEGTDAAELDPDAPALVRYATAFEAPADLPLMSIVLVHQGASALGGDVLDVLPPNVGFAVDAATQGAADIARAYRSAGREVVMIPALPSGAAPQDIEQALGANFDLVPEAVAVMDVSGSSFQSNRAAVEQVVDVVSASGHGMITFPRGLNTAHQAAQRAGVPTGLIFRNLDGASEDQETIRRNLDRAAFRARQDEAVILVGTTGSTMLSALTEWVLGNRAASVAIAPISAALGG